MLGTITTQSITFFPTMDAAQKMAEANGGEAEGFVASASPYRAGKYVIEVRDVDASGKITSFLLGYL